MTIILTEEQAIRLLIIIDFYTSEEVTTDQKVIEQCDTIANYIKQQLKNTKNA